MARYGKIETGFWHSPKIRRLSQEARYLMLYLLSSPHGNALGCFVLHEGYIAADLGWAPDAVAHSVEEVVNKGLVERDGDTSLTRILGWWGHNSIENANVAKHVAKEIAALPACEVKNHLIEAVLTLTDLHPVVMQTLSERLGKPFRNRSEAVSPQSAERFRNQEPNLTLPNPTDSVALAIASGPALKVEKSNKRGTRIAADWRASDRDREFARSLGFSDPEIDKVCAGFLDYWTAKAGPNGVKVDWSATWRVWMRKEAENATRKPMRLASTVGHSIDWDRAVADYRASRGSRWAHRQYGPEPGYSGCRAPVAILQKHGFAGPE
jgi:hypothetical protein